MMNGCRMLYCKSQHACPCLLSRSLPSHFRNWRIFGFTRDAISSSIPLLGYYSQADFFRLLFGSMRSNFSTRLVLRGDVDQALEDDVDQALIVMTKPSKMMSTRPW